jgi:hypothetical protein
MSALPDSVTSSAFVASNGEFGWRREDVESAIRAIRDAGYAILGGEAWLVTAWLARYHSTARWQHACSSSLGDRAAVIGRVVAGLLRSYGAREHRRRSTDGLRVGAGDTA